MADTFGSQSTLRVDDQTFTIRRLDAVYKQYALAERLPYSLKILLENLLRTEDGVNVRSEDVLALAQWGAAR